MNKEERGIYNFEEYKDLKYPIIKRPKTNKKLVVLIFLILILAGLLNIAFQNTDKIKTTINKLFEWLNIVLYMIVKKN